MSKVAHYTHGKNHWWLRARASLKLVQTCSDMFKHVRNVFGLQVSREQVVCLTLFSSLSRHKKSGLPPAMPIKKNGLFHRRATTGTGTSAPYIQGEVGVLF